MISSYCKKAGNIHAAIEFLLMAKQVRPLLPHFCVASAGHLRLLFSLRFGSCFVADLSTVGQS